MKINQEAPVVQTEEISISESPETVWNILTDIDNWDQWNDRIKNPKIQGKLEAGSTFIWTSNGSKIKSTIHTVSPFKMFGWSGKAFGVDAIHNWYLEPTETGTKVQVKESMEGWIIQLIKKSMNKKLADDMEYWLEQLKIESEK